MSITITPLNSGMCTSNPKTYHYHPSTHKYYANVSNEDKALPVFCYLLNTGDELILIDTGMSDTDRANTYHHPGSVQLPDEAMPRAVMKAGYNPDDVTKIIFTHLHWDHTFYMKDFKNAKYYAQRKEYEFAMNPIPLYYKSYEYKDLGIEAPFIGVKFELIDGVGDAIFLLDNLKPVPQIHYDLTPTARFANIVEWWESVREIKRRCPDIKMVLPAHEPTLIERFKETPVLGL